MHKFLLLFCPIFFFPYIRAQYNVEKPDSLMLQRMIENKVRKINCIEKYRVTTISSFRTIDSLGNDLERISYHVTQSEEDTTMVRESMEIVRYVYNRQGKKISSETWSDYWGDDIPRVLYDSAGWQISEARFSETKNKYSDKSQYDAKGRLIRYEAYDDDQLTLTDSIYYNDQGDRFEWIRKRESQYDLRRWHRFDAQGRVVHTVSFPYLEEDPAAGGVIVQKFYYDLKGNLSCSETNVSNCYAPACIRYTNYKYNPSGQLVLKTENGESDEYYYLPNGLLAEIVKSSLDKEGKMLKEFISFSYEFGD